MLTLLPRLTVLTRAPARRGVARRVRGRRAAARRAVLLGGVAFALLTLGLAAAAETRKPQWRDPEYGNRLRQLRRWQAERPDRPLVLVFGSSRAQMSVSPADMGFPDEPGQPLVYNFGYRAAVPVYVWLQLARLLDDGVKPAAVVVMIAAYEVAVPNRPEDRVPPWWGARLSAGDLRHLAPYTADPTVHGRALAAARRDPWSARRAALVSDLLPDWQLPDTRRLHHSAWERMDGYGFSPFPWLPVSAESRAAAAVENRAHVPELNKCPGAAADRVLRDLAARCRAEGIALAFCWAPEGPSYRVMYTPEGLANRDAYGQRLAADLGVPVFPAPEHLEEGEFGDGYHLLPGGATKYSRWLADTHLHPWLASPKISD